MITTQQIKDRTVILVNGVPILEIEEFPDSSECNHLFLIPINSDIVQSEPDLPWSHELLKDVN